MSQRGAALSAGPKRRGRQHVTEESHGCVAAAGAVALTEDDEGWIAEKVATCPIRDRYAWGILCRAFVANAALVRELTSGARVLSVDEAKLITTASRAQASMASQMGILKDESDDDDGDDA